MEVDILAALAALAPKLGGTGVEKAQRLTGGASMETWAFNLLGAGEPRPLILRRRAVPLDPETSRSASMAAEHPIQYARKTRLSIVDCISLLPTPRIIHDVD